MVTEEFKLQPLNSTVLQGSDVRYTATVVGTWQSMTWTVGEYLVATVHVPGTGNISVFSDQYAARFCVKDDISCVEFFMYNVTRGQSGKVICFVMGKYGSKTADLYVQGKVINMNQICLMGNLLFGILRDTCYCAFPLTSDPR